MNAIALKFEQYDKTFYVTTLNFNIINKIAEVLIYGESKWGYQRAVNDLHLKRIIKTLGEQNDIISPTSIVLGINRDDLIVNDITNDVSKGFQSFNDKNLKLISMEEIKKFRIIDGQHRIEAFRRYLNEKGNENKGLAEDYIFSVIIMVVEKNKRSEEVKIFTSINSKAKPLKTDLAMLATYNYQLLEESVDVSQLDEHLITRLIFKLNNNDLNNKNIINNFWHNGIKLDANNPNAIGSIGFKSYLESIDRIVKTFIKKSGYESRLKKVVNSDYDKLNEILNEMAEIMANQIIIPAWAIIYEKWPKCFNKRSIFTDDGYSIAFYDKEYYIQMNMGVKALNGILTDIFINNGNINDTIDEFKKVINRSYLNFEDWTKNGRMQGMSSESGIANIKKMIKNDQI